MNKRELIKRLSIFALVLLLICGGCAIIKNRSTTVSRTFFTADTTCTITLFDGSEDTLNSAVELTNSIANKLNCYDEGAELFLLNKSKGLATVSDELMDAVKIGIKYSELCPNGSFDITVRPVTKLWDFKNGVMPKASDIENALKKVGYQRVELTSNGITLNDNAEIDLGAVAKGYIASKISDFLTKNGVKSAIINLGGNVTVLGDNDGDDVLVDIARPFGDGNIATIKAKDVSVVTSGTYQRSFKKDGVLYHHLLNAKTGLPQNSNLNSVTVITKNTAEADAMSTLLFLLGKDEGLKRINQTAEFEAVFIDQNNNISLSNGLIMDNQNNITIK